MIAISLQDEPYHEMSYLDARPGGGCVRKPLHFLKGRITGFPRAIPPLVATADLQGRTQLGDVASGLLGCAVAQHLSMLHADAGLPDPRDSVGLLAGDFYTVPYADRRGGTGDVTEVWESMRLCLGGLSGVAGNHDTFGGGPPAGCLDGHCNDLMGMRVGGVSGIIGDPRKRNRKTAAHFIELLAQVIAHRPDVVVLHSAPHVDDACPGDRHVAHALDDLAYGGLVVCGHVPWRQRVRTVGWATVLNVHEAVVTLVAG